MTAFRGVMVVLIAVAALLQTSETQQLGSARQLSVFTATDKAFRFSYPSDFRLCKEGDNESCPESFIPACKEDAIVCVVYPVKKFGRTNLTSETFQVREIISGSEVMTADICATPHAWSLRDPDRPEFLISAKHPVEMIGGRQFLHGTDAGVATGHWISIDVYRAFHKQRCFELGLSETGDQPTLTDPPLKTLTPVQQKKLDQSMSRILHSFRFVN